MKEAIGIIGAGNMGSAILAGIHNDYTVYVTEQDKKRSALLRRRYKVQTVELDILLDKVKYVILAVKPQNFDGLLKDVRKFDLKKKVFVSVAAGITTQYIEKRLGEGVKVVRTMPNLPAQIGQGLTGVAKGSSATGADVRMVAQIFNHVGKSIIVEEKFIDAVTAVSGSGPAYVFLFIECLSKATKQLGIKGRLADELVLQTIRGSLSLFENQKVEASVLRKRVTSKGGTTQAAIETFEKKKIDKIFIEALANAEKRAKQLSK